MWRYTNNILFSYTGSMSELSYPRIGETVVINAQEQHIVEDIKHFFDGDGYTVYIHLKEREALLT